MRSQHLALLQGTPIPLARQQTTPASHLRDPVPYFPFIDRWGTPALLQLKQEAKHSISYPSPLLGLTEKPAPFWGR